VLSRDGGMVYAQVSKTCGSNPVRVRAPLSALSDLIPNMMLGFVYSYDCRLLRMVIASANTTKVVVTRKLILAPAQNSSGVILPNNTIKKANNRGTIKKFIK
jgi:hypothetical protein